MTRQEQIAKAQIWQVYPDKDPDNILFEGRKTKYWDKKPPSVEFAGIKLATKLDFFNQ